MLHPPNRIVEQGTVSLLTARGSDDDFCAHAADVLGRLVDELDRDPAAATATSGQAPTKKQSLVYTVWLWPSSLDERMKGGPTPLYFPWADEEALAESMTTEVLALFAAYGSKGPERLLGSIRFCGSVYVTGEPPTDTIWKNVVPFATDTERKTAWIRTESACEQAIALVAHRAKRTVLAVQQAALDLARERLRDAALSVTGEFGRYFSSVDPSRTLTAGAPPSQVVIHGPDLPALLAALRDLAKLRRTVRVAGKEVSLIQDRAQALGVLHGGTLQPGERAFEGLLAPAERAQLGYANGEVETAIEDLALALSVHCRRFPVLHRMWASAPELDRIVVVSDHDGIGRLRPEPGLDPPALRQAALRISALGTALYAPLRDTLSANRALAQRLEDDHGLVWTYPALISATLAEVGHAEPSVEFMAAMERLAEAKGSALETAQTVVGVLDLAAGAAAAAPPVLLTLAVANAVLSAATVVSEYRDLRDKQDAYGAVLDPSAAIAAQPGYGAFALAIAFAMLDLPELVSLTRALGPLSGGTAIVPGGAP